MKKQLLECGLESDPSDQSLRLELSSVEQDEFITVSEIGCDQIGTTLPLKTSLNPVNGVDFETGADTEAEMN